MRSTWISRSLGRLLHAWKRLQVSYYGGKYSIHRLLALQAYTRNASLFRVLLVCIGTPLPMVAFVSMQALVPLQEPTAGWRENYGFWIRSGILSFVVAHTLTTQATYLIDNIVISASRMVLLSACAAIVFTAFAAAISAALIFPVPFFVLTLSPVFYVALIISYRIVLGKDILQRMLQKREQLIQYISFVAAQNLMVFTYPAYETLFRVAKGTSYQVPVILLLPIIKVAVKNVVLRSMKRMEDMMPEAVIFTVDFFNSVYVATCMQSASSATAITAITVTDLSQTVLMLFGLHRCTATLLLMLHIVAGSAPDNESMVELLCAICRDPEKFEKQSRLQISIRSCLPLALSMEDTELLNRLEVLPSRTNSRIEVHPSLLKVGSYRSVHNIPSDAKTKRTIRSIFVRERNGVYPFNSVGQSGIVQWRSSASQMSLHRSMALREALEALFTTECIVVTAYLEAFVPLFYCCYISVMVYVPNSRYHTEVIGLTPENVGATVFPVFVFGLLQIATFLVLALVIKRNCGMQMLYQLAFVLEMQMPLIQGKLVLWVLITLCFRIVHFGVDFTFKFKNEGYRS